MKSPFKSEHQKKYFFNTGWLLGEKVVRIGVNALVGILLARYLAPEGMGFLNYALSIVFFFLPIATLGLGDIVIRELVSKPDDEKKILGTAIGLRTLGSLIAMVLIFLSVFFFESNALQAKLILLVSLTNIMQIPDVLDRYFQARLKAKSSVAAYTIATLLVAVFKLLLIYLKAPLEYFALSQVLDHLVAAVVLIILFKRTGFTFSGLSFDKVLAKSMVKQSWPLILSGLMVVLYMRIDTIMIRSFLDFEAVGNFSVAVKLSEAHYIIPMVLLASLYPAIINGKSLGEEIYRQRLQKLFDILTWISLPAAIILTLIATPLTDFLYGEKYVGEDTVLAIHIWAGVFAFWGTAMNKWLIIEGLQRYITFCTLLGCSVNIILNLILIERIGIAGAAIATVAAQFSACILSLTFTKRTRKLLLIYLESLNFVRVFGNVYRKGMSVMGR